MKSRVGCGTQYSSASIVSSRGRAEPDIVFFVLRFLSSCKDGT